MMAVVNLFSSAFTAASIFVGMEVGYVFDFLASCPEICMHIFLMAVCSAVGQLFIFHTIKASPHNHPPLPALQQRPSPPSPWSNRTHAQRAL